MIRLLQRYWIFKEFVTYNLIRNVLIQRTGEKEECEHYFLLFHWYSEYVATFQRKATKSGEKGHAGWCAMVWVCLFALEVAKLATLVSLWLILCVLARLTQRRACTGATSFFIYSMMHKCNNFIYKSLYCTSCCICVQGSVLLSVGLL